MHSFAPEFIKLSTSDCAPVCSVQCSGATAQGGSIMIKRRTRRLSHAITLHYGSQDFKVKMNGSSSTWRLHISSFFSLFVSFFFFGRQGRLPPHHLTVFSFVKIHLCFCGCAKWKTCFWSIIIKILPVWLLYSLLYLSQNYWTMYSCTKYNYILTIY